MSDPAGCKLMKCKDLINGVCHYEGSVCKFRQDEFDLEDFKDAERFRWLLHKGVAWNGCYHGEWKPGEWLYDFQSARTKIDVAMEWDLKRGGNNP